MSRLRLIRRRPVAAPEPRGGPWGPLAEPVLPNETDARMRAQSLLAGLQYRDGSTNPGTLTYPQACDVLAWNLTRRSKA